MNSTFSKYSVSSSYSPDTRDHAECRDGFFTLPSLLIIHNQIPQIFLFASYEIRMHLKRSKSIDAIHSIDWISLTKIADQNRMFARARSNIPQANNFESFFAEFFHIVNVEKSTRRIEFFVREEQNWRLNAQLPIVIMALGTCRVNI